ncbi:tetratricopeptide repeat protein (plasmid) [Nostoc sp. UHCC 0302]|uniref:tetratricopeptide repeat protein n=1 Tax=Nostoc sp. UHCC 0302 TaxID=3134896 RepID=UPI00311CDA89
MAPKNSIAYNNRGLSRKEIRDYQGAISDYTKAIELDSSNARAYLNRGLVRVEMGDKKGAIADYKKGDSLFLQQGETGYHQTILEEIRQLNAGSK